MFRIHQDLQGLCMVLKGPTDGAEGCNPPQEVEKAREAGYFSINWENNDQVDKVYNFFKSLTIYCCNI